MEKEMTDTQTTLGTECGLLILDNLFIFGLPHQVSQHFKSIVSSQIWGIVVKNIYFWDGLGGDHFFGLSTKKKTWDSEDWVWQPALDGSCQVQQL